MPFPLRQTVFASLLGFCSLFMGGLDSAGAAAALTVGPPNACSGSCGFDTIQDTGRVAAPGASPDLAPSAFALALALFVAFKWRESHR